MADLRPSLRFDVFKRDNFTCRYCGRRTPEAILQVDHVIPRSAGGPDELYNLVTSCAQCNLGKGARLLRDLPEDLDIADRAAALAEQERQILELRYWEQQRKDREDAELDQLEQLWPFEGHGRTHWARSSVLQFLRKLGYAEVAEIVEYVADQAHLSTESRAWLVFCKMCWNRVRAQESRP